MQRASATLLLLLFSFSLIGPQLLAGMGSTLPACCRRGGKHHCAEGASSQSGQPAGVAIHTSQKCAFFPDALVVQASAKAASPGAGRRFFNVAAAGPTPLAQAVALYSTAFSRSCQKRGPPSFIE